MKFVLGCITSFDAKISGMKDKVDEPEYNPRCKFLTSVTFKILITKHQDLLSLINMGGGDMGSIKEVNSSSI